MKVKFEIFESRTKSLKSIFSQAADFAATIGPKRLITITVDSVGGADFGGLLAMVSVTVWYWSEDEHCIALE